MWGRVRDPVCNATVKKAKAFKYIYLGKPLYFDSEACLQTFKEDPKKFLGDGTKINLLQKLSDASDGERKTCH